MQLANGLIMSSDGARRKVPRGGAGDGVVDASG